MLFRWRRLLCRRRGSVYGLLARLLIAIFVCLVFFSAFNYKSRCRYEMPTVFGDPVFLHSDSSRCRISFDSLGLHVRSVLPSVYNIIQNRLNLRYGLRSKFCRLLSALWNVNQWMCKMLIIIFDKLISGKNRYVKDLKCDTNRVIIVIIIIIIIIMTTTITLLCRSCTSKCTRDIDNGLGGKAACRRACRWKMESCRL